MRATVFVIVAAALAACGSGTAAGGSEATALTITYWENGPNAGPPKKWTLRCAPARGTLPRPAIACRTIAAGGVKLFAAPIPKDVACTQIYGGPQSARVVGTVKGQRVSTMFTRRDGCQIARWDRLSPWLLPRGGVT